MAVPREVADKKKTLILVVEILETLSKRQSTTFTSCKNTTLLKLTICIFMMLMQPLSVFNGIQNSCMKALKAVEENGGLTT